MVIYKTLQKYVKQTAILEIVYYTVNVYAYIKKGKKINSLFAPFFLY